MRKKVLALFLSVSLCITVGACSNPSSGVSFGSTTTLTIAARDGSHCDVLNAVKGDFEKANNCTINILPYSSDELHNKIIEDSANDVGSIDIIMIDDPLMPEYIEKNILCNLTMMGYTDDEDFVEKSRLLGKDPYPLGATYALPFAGNVQLLFYNSYLIEKSADISSWQGIYEAAQKAKDNGKTGFGIRVQTGNPIVSDFLPILWAFGGDIFDEHKVVLDSRESREALEFFCKLYSTGDNFSKDELVNGISAGNIALGLGWPSWLTFTTGTTTKISMIPGKKNASSNALPTGEIGNWLIGITKNSANKELALEAIKYLTSTDVQRKALVYGGVPTRVSIFKDSDILEKYPNFEAIYLGTNNSRVRPRTTKWSRIEEVFGEQLVKCLNGEQSVDDTITISHKAIEELAVE